MEQVTVEQAARELGITAPCLRELLIRDKLPIGYGYQLKESSKRKFVIYRGLLNQYIASVEGGEK